MRDEREGPEGARPSLCATVSKQYRHMSPLAMLGAVSVDAEEGDAMITEGDSSILNVFFFCLAWGLLNHCGRQEEMRRCSQSAIPAALFLAIQVRYSPIVW